MGFTSPHTHFETALSASTLNSFIDRAVELGRTHIAYTDVAYLAATLRVRDLCKKKKLKLIPGVEILFKDPNCEIAKGTKSQKFRYSKLTLHAPSQAAYQALCRLVSVDRPKVTWMGSEYGAWTWPDLTEAAQAGCMAVSSDLHDLALKPLLNSNFNQTTATVDKLKEMFGDRYYLSIVGVDSSKVIRSFVVMKFADGSKMAVPASAIAKTGTANRVSMKEIVDNPKRHSFLKEVVVGGVLQSVNKEVVKAILKFKAVDVAQNDPQAVANRVAKLIAKQKGIKLLYSDYAYYASKEDKPIQDVRLASEERREYGTYHMQSNEEAVSYMLGTLGMSEDEAKQVLANNADWAKRFDDLSLEYPMRVPAVEGGKNPLEVCAAIIKEVGRMKWDDPVYRERLTKEIEVLAKNGKINLLPYFLPIRDVLNHYKESGRLVGPARGSAAGSLLMYLMGITQVDPIKYDLSFERFLSLDRILTGNMPDVDVDLVNRDLLVGADGRSGYLYGRWGNKAAQISTRHMLRLKSSILDVNRYLNNNSVDPAIQKLTNSLPNAPQGVSDSDFVFGMKDDEGNTISGLLETNDDLKAYVKARPKEWELVQRTLGITRQMSKHASAFVISDTPIHDIVPMFEDGVTTQYDAKPVEASGLIKYDFLVVKQLEDIELCIKLVNEKNGYSPKIPGTFTHKDQEVNVWDLPEDLDVFASVWEGDTETCFQINTQSMVPFVQKILPKSIEDLSTILALVRPGPLDFIDETTGRNMAEEYIERRFGRSQPDIKELADLLPETWGVQVYQEQTSKIAKQIGMMKPSDAEELRRVFSKKDKTKALKMKPLFMEGAIKSVGKDKAETIWAQMETSSRYSFNRSHSISYAMITYACMYLKFHFPLEWWAAVLSNADEKEISTKLFKHVRDKLMPPDINLSRPDIVSVNYQTQKLLGKISMMKGMGDSVSAKLASGKPYKDIEDFVRKKVAGPSLAKKLIHVGVLNSLFSPTATLIQKMEAYERAVLQVEYDAKVAAGKKPKPIGSPVVDPEYLAVSPLQDFCTKKSILPTLPMNLSDIFLKATSFMREGGSAESVMFSDSYGYPVRYLTGDQVQRLESMSDLDREIKYCFAAYIIDHKEIPYDKNRKKMLKLVLDVDGNISERVMWPDYNTGQLRSVPGLQKKAVALVFCKLRPGKGSSVLSVRIEPRSLTKETE